jgi:CBS domain-containing protein
MDRVRDAMLPDPRTLSASATAREAAELLVRPEVASVLVVADGLLVGIVRPADLVVRVVAAGRDPETTPLADVADPDVFTLDVELPLDAAYRLLEEHDSERAPVLEDGRLVGVLSRSALQRRLAEDEPPAGDGETVDAI